MPKMMQIDENDLGELERALPEIAEALSCGTGLSPRLRVKLRRTQSILSNVRWNYGPVGEIEVINKDDCLD